ncbi:MAG: class F sortase [Caldilinea sp. CFX5]|nr:class F sortase [Caldilinea sp. CFX5]
MWINLLFTHARVAANRTQAAAGKGYRLTLGSILLLLVSAACQTAAATPTPLALPTATTAAVAEQPPAVTVQSNEVITPEAAGIPVRLTAPTLNFAVAVEPMSWQVSEVEGQRQAVWQVPAASAGWHINSARPGTAGNVVISGNHLVGAAVFAPLARGEITVDTQLVVNDDQGRSFLYQVREVAQPIPVNGSAAEKELAMSYIAPSAQAQLTLVTGWPDFSDTHYLFVRAEFVGRVQ